MLRVCIVEKHGHPAPGILGRRLGSLDGFVVRTVPTVPSELDIDEVSVLNNIPADALIEGDQILRFIEAGGGVFAIHDSVYPYVSNKKFIEACGIRPAYGTVEIVTEPNRYFMRVNVASPDPGNPLSRFPIDPVPDAAGHPILEEISTFELAEEAWAQNLAPGVRLLLSADVGDRVFAPQRFREGPVPVAACTKLGEGRLAWFSLGHFAPMYNDSNFLRFAANALRWLGKETNERSFGYDLFLSFSSINRDESREIEKRARGIGLRVFLDEQSIEPGAVWEDVIRQALVNSRELAVLATPESLQSEWVTTEWGAAWALGKTITPIILRLNPRDLSARLKQRQWIDYHKVEGFLQALKSRG